jgi:hypothetical protein
VSENHTTTAAKVTAELNIHLEDHVSTKTVRRQFHKSSILGRAAIAKPPITEKTQKGERDGVMIIKPGRLMTGNRNMFLHVVPKHLAGFMFGECPRKSIIMNACFQL